MFSANGVHIDGPTGPPGLDDTPGICCFGAAVYGEYRCTCWEPVYDLEQQPIQWPEDGPLSEAATTRSKCCHDCAYRKGSPERERGEGDQLDDYAVDGRSEFWCHQGVRRIVGWRHPDGRYIEAPPGCYDPPHQEKRVVFKADGTVGERCAGWAATRRGVLSRD